MKVKRLKQLVEFLRDKVPAERFGLYEWRFTYRGDPIDQRIRYFAEYIENEDFKKESCGYHGCACGWTASYKKFNKKGFTYKDSMLQYYNSKTNETYRGWNAVNKFFGLTQEEAEYLFSSNSYKNHEERTDLELVISRIERFIEIGEMEELND